MVALHQSSQAAEQSLRASGPIVALIPAFNEERFIGSLVLNVRAVVDQVVVIDDGSHDRTAELARKAGATVVQHQVNQGKAAAVNSGFAYARRLQPAAVVMLDGDGQHCADDIPTVLSPIHEGTADVVVGSRFLAVKSEIPIYRRFGQHGLTLVTNVASGVRCSDSQSGFRAFSVRALEALWFSQGGFSIESEMQFLVREHRLRVLEVPIQVVYAERAKRNPIQHGLQVINSVLRLVGQIRPLLFFGVMGLSVLVTGLLLGLLVVEIYANTEQLAVGYSLVTVLLCVVGTVLLFSGVILHSVRGMLIDLRRGLMDRLSSEVDGSKVAVLQEQGSISTTVESSDGLFEQAVDGEN